MLRSDSIGELVSGVDFVFRGARGDPLNAQHCLQRRRKLDGTIINSHQRPEGGETRRLIARLDAARRLVVDGVFSACMPMYETIAVVRRETNSFRWPLFMVVYMLVTRTLAR